MTSNEHLRRHEPVLRVNGNPAPAWVPVLRLGSLITNQPTMPTTVGPLSGPWGCKHQVMSPHSLRQQSVGLNLGVFSFRFHFTNYSCRCTKPPLTLAYNADFWASWAAWIKASSRGPTCGHGTQRGRHADTTVRPCYTLVDVWAWPKALHVTQQTPKVGRAARPATHWQREGGLSWSLQPSASTKEQSKKPKSEEVAESPLPKTSAYAKIFVIDLMGTEGPWLRQRAQLPAHPGQHPAGIGSTRFLNPPQPGADR